ncbi:hypothetical protein TNCV_4075271 [Trichonephila clavipes]|nr:hypothetical protein TNCV_4075271 [Trichonephila clavipes]
MARKRAENRERSVGYPRFVKSVLDSKPCGEKEKITRVPRNCDTRTHLKKKLVESTPRRVTTIIKAREEPAR